MKQIAMAIATLGLAACGEPAPAPAAQQAPPADEWLTFGGSVPDSYYSGITIHETPAGLAGVLVSTDDTAVPLRGIQRTETTLSFIVPAIGAAFTGTKSEGVWKGDWIDPSLHGNSWVHLEQGADEGAHQRGPLSQLSKLPDGRRMHIVCSGEGSPVVLLDYGAGGTMKEDWGDMAKLAAEKAQTKVCAYDRAARGLSDPGPMPRDTAAVADDIDAMLAAANLPPPYILVGHSLGSYHVRQFANTRADKTAGLVLVDPSSDGQFERFNAVVPKMQKLQDEMMQSQAALGCISKLTAAPVPPDDPFAQQCGGNDPAVILATKSEIQEMPGRSTDQLRASRRSWGAMPVIVLTRGDHDKEMPLDFTSEDRAAMQSVRKTMHAEMAALSTAGEQRHVAGAGHYIQRDSPEAVLTAIADVVAKVRKTP